LALILLNTTHPASCLGVQFLSVLHSVGTAGALSHNSIGCVSPSVDSSTCH